MRRSSRLVGRWQEGYWRRFSRREANELILAAKRFDRLHKAPGKGNGPLGDIGRDILEYLANLAVAHEGQVFPSIDGLMGVLRRSRDAVVRALKALSEHGFLEWVRRYVEADERGVRGPQVKQTSNAYRLSLPKKLLRLVRKAAPPDEAVRRAQVRAELDRYIAEEQAQSPLGRALERLGGSVADRAGGSRSERESEIRSQSALKSESKR